MPSNSPTCESTTLSGAKSILKTRDGTQFATNGIVEDSKMLVQNTIEVIKRKVISTIQNSETITDDTLSKVQSVFDDETLTNPFHGLET